MNLPRRKGKGRRYLCNEKSNKKIDWRSEISAKDNKE